MCVGLGQGMTLLGELCSCCRGERCAGWGQPENICCSAPGWCQPASHRWQLEVSPWPTARRLLQGLDVVLEKQNVRGWVR